MQSASSPSDHLVRTMGLFPLVVYGIGDMVGAGIYATIGQAAGLLGKTPLLPDADPASVASREKQIPFSSQIASRRDYNTPCNEI